MYTLYDMMFNTNDECLSKIEGDINISMMIGVTLYIL